MTIEQVLIQGNAATRIFPNCGTDGPEAHRVHGVRVIGNGGNDQPRTDSGLAQIGVNFCGDDTQCP